ncbi:MAG: RepB family DNA primase [Bryobacterales bacterium]|nr:RepB family DNA primase [Bryobacterales bacterium]MEB2363888.1 DNA-primase RepB domain-containing protein [Bryobacterales bacterium]
MANPTENAVRRQVEVMGAATFEVGVLIPANDTGAARRDAIMLLRTWDTETIYRSIPWLRAKNASGAAIYIRPHGEHHLSLVDDLTAVAVQQMKERGFEPTLVVETSPGNFQAWVNHGTILDKRMSTSAAKALAEKFRGDPGAADWRHFGRLAGFVNRKRRYQKPDGLFPFVRIAEQHHGLVYSKADSFISAVSAELKRHQTRWSPHAESIEFHGRVKSIEDFRSNPAYCGDGNRIDLAYAVYALAHGVHEADVRRAIQSRDLSKKGSDARQEAYVDRTIKKAFQHCVAGRSR